MQSTLSWVCCQLGAREHYSIPRALHAAGRNTVLVTDIKSVLPASFGATPLLRRFAGRTAEGFPNSHVRDSTLSALMFRARQRLLGQRGWKLVVERNLWFEEAANNAITSLCKSQTVPSRGVVLFSYSYTALKCVQAAKQKGWTSIVGAIDPGPMEEAIVASEVQRHPDLNLDWEPAPPVHWERWKEELIEADHIVVNSKWSVRGLEYAGIPRHKIKIVPLAYEPTAASLQFRRDPVTAFTASRPLRVLFLGQIVLRKGMAAVLQAIDLLKDAPVEIDIVGPIGIRIPQRYLGNPKVRWVGPVTRDKVSDYFRSADVFLFPTLSDGFGLTQLEAFAWGLPIIASEFCGDVVENHRTGIILDHVSGEDIAASISALISSPSLLIDYSQAINRRPFGLTELAASLAELEALHSPH